MTHRRQRSPLLQDRWSVRWCAGLRFRGDWDPSDNGVESVVEPLHSQLHHLLQGVVLCALVLITRRLGRGEEDHHREEEMDEDDY